MVVRQVDVVVVGGGQAPLAAGYYLQRAGLEPETDYVILDAGDAPGGAWRNAPLPPARHVVDHLTRYEERCRLPVHRPVPVTAVRRIGEKRTGRLAVDSHGGIQEARFVVSATGTWARPFVPSYPGMTTWVTMRPPVFLPDDIDGQALFPGCGRRAGAR